MAQKEGVIKIGGGLEKRRGLFTGGNYAYIELLKKQEEEKIGKKKFKKNLSRTPKKKFKNILSQTLKN